MLQENEEWQDSEPNYLPVRQTQDHINSLEKQVFELKMKLHLMSVLETGENGHETLLQQIITLQNQNQVYVKGLEEKDAIIQEAIEEVHRLELSQLESTEKIASYEQRIAELEGRSKSNSKSNSIIDLGDHSQEIDQESNPENVDDDRESQLREFQEIAMEATREMLELQEKLKLQQEQIDALLSRPRSVDNTVQTINQSIDRDCQTTINQETQEVQTTTITKVSKACQTLEIKTKSPRKPTPDELEINRQRYITELKERNDLLVRINQNLNLKMGLSDSTPVTTFTAIKKVLIEKIKMLKNQKVLNDALVESEQGIASLKTQLASLSTHHEKEKEAARIRINELVQEKRKLEMEMIQDQKRINMYRHNHSDDLQQQYIKAVASSEELKKKLEKIEVKVNFAIAHLKKYSVTLDLDLIAVARKVLEI